MHLSFVFTVTQLPVLFALFASKDGTNFTQWSEDDWLEARFSIPTKFSFNHQRYDHILFRTRMNQWALELSHGNESHPSKLWTELHVFLDRRQPSSSLNNSLNGHVRNVCRPPVISPLTNDSTARMPELLDMDKRIGDYFAEEGLFRTINYIRCNIDEQRRQPSMHLQMSIYLLTNREFQSLLYIDMMNSTRAFLLEHRAKFYLHSHERKFKYSFNLSADGNGTSTSGAFMVKLYTSTTRVSSNSVSTFDNGRIVVLLVGFYYVLQFIQ